VTPASLPPLSSTARLLGFAGLLPQLAAVGMMLWEPRAAYDLPVVVAYGYASLILSFLGGIWWGFAMRRTERQGSRAVLAVIPSLVPVALLPLAMISWGWPLVLLGSAIILTLPVDRHLAMTGEAPAGWMRLRVPLSLGLGSLTILAGGAGTW
jgi:hypothetical protein